MSLASQCMYNCMPTLLLLLCGLQTFTVLCEAVKLLWKYMKTALFCNVFTEFVQEESGSKDTKLGVYLMLARQSLKMCWKICCYYSPEFGLLWQEQREFTCCSGLWWTNPYEQMKMSVMLQDSCWYEQPFISVLLEASGKRQVGIVTAAYMTLGQQCWLSWASAVILRRAQKYKGKVRHSSTCYVLKIRASVQTIEIRKWNDPTNVCISLNFMAWHVKQDGLLYSAEDL